MNETAAQCKCVASRDVAIFHRLGPKKRGLRFRICTRLPFEQSDDPIVRRLARGAQVRDAPAVSAAGEAVQVSWRGYPWGGPFRCLCAHLPPGSLHVTQA